MFSGPALPLFYSLVDRIQRISGYNSPSAILDDQDNHLVESVVIHTEPLVLRIDGVKEVESGIRGLRVSLIKQRLRLTDSSFKTEHLFAPQRDLRRADAIPIASQTRAASPSATPLMKVRAASSDVDIPALVPGATHPVVSMSVIKHAAHNTLSVTRGALPTSLDISRGSCDPVQSPESGPLPRYRMCRRVAVVTSGRREPSEGSPSSSLACFGARVSQPPVISVRS